MFSGIDGAGRARVRGIEYYYMDRVIIRCCGDIQGDPGFQIKKADLFHSIKNDTIMADEPVKSKRSLMLLLLIMTGKNYRNALLN